MALPLSPYPSPCIQVFVSSVSQDGLNTWQVSLVIYTPQNIGVDNTGSVNPYTYDAYNILVGYWFSSYNPPSSSNSVSGNAWIIKDINPPSSDGSQITVLVEDLESYNNSIDPLTKSTGSQPIPPVGTTGYVWALGENGLPNLYAVDFFGTDSQTFSQYVNDLTGRFFSRNYSTTFVNASQTANTFQVGNFLTLDDINGYQIATSTSTSIIGIVTSVGYPGYYGSINPNNFTYRPFGQYLTYFQLSQNFYNPSQTKILTETIGTLYYLDSSGGLTTTASGNGNPVYIQTTLEGDGILLKGTFNSSSGGGNVPNATVYGQYPYWNSYTNSWQIGGSGSVALGASAGLTGQQTGAIAIGINAGSLTQGTG